MPLAGHSLFEQHFGRVENKKENCHPLPRPKHDAPRSVVADLPHIRNDGAGPKCRSGLVWRHSNSSSSLSVAASSIARREATRRAWIKLAVTGDVKSLCSRCGIGLKTCGRSIVVNVSLHDLHLRSRQIPPCRLRESMTSLPVSRLQEGHFTLVPPSAAHRSKLAAANRCGSALPPPSQS